MYQGLWKEQHGDGGEIRENVWRKGGGRFTRLLVGNEKMGKEN